MERGRPLFPFSSCRVQQIRLLSLLPRTISLIPGRKKRPKMMKRHSNLPLPENIMTNVLLHLPFQSVLACKRVSKKFSSLINHPNFFSAYDHKSVLVFVDKYGRLYCGLLGHKGSDRHLSYTVRYIPIYDRIRRLLSEPSSPMVCFATENDQFLFYNLFTGASYTVSNAPRATKEFGGDRWVCYGFGYDRRVDDYKILAKKFDMSNDQREDKNLFWIYSFKSDTWRAVLGFPYRAYRWAPSHQACFFNGVLHWVVPKREGREEVIVTFDLRTSRFGEMSVPVDEGGSMNKLMELDGRLCYKFHDDHGVMKDYGVHESWTKLFSLDKSKFVTDGFSMDDVATLYESRDGGKVVLFGCSYRKALVYDIEHGSAEVLS